MEGYETKAQQDAVTRLQEKFPSVPRQVIADEVDQGFRKYDDRPVRRYVALLVEREVRHILRQTRGIAS